MCVYNKMVYLSIDVYNIVKICENLWYPAEILEKRTMKSKIVLFPVDQLKSINMVQTKKKYAKAID